MRTLLDANCILRYLLADIPIQPDVSLLPGRACRIGSESFFISGIVVYCTVFGYYF